MVWRWKNWIVHNCSYFHFSRSHYFPGAFGLFYLFKTKLIYLFFYLLPYNNYGSFKLFIWILWTCRVITVSSRINTPSFVQLCKYVKKHSFMRVLFYFFGSLKFSVILVPSKLWKFNWFQQYAVDFILIFNYISYTPVMWFTWTLILLLLVLNLLIYVFEYILPYFLQDHSGNGLFQEEEIFVLQVESYKIWKIKNYLISNKGIYSIIIFIFLLLLHIVYT